MALAFAVGCTRHSGSSLLGDSLPVAFEPLGLDVPVRGFRRIS